MKAELTEATEDKNLIILNDKLKLRVQSYFRQIKELETRVNQDIFLIVESSGYDTEKYNVTLTSEGDINLIEK